jgi:hypothetical protein
MILEIFSPKKNLAKLAFLTENPSKTYFHNIVFDRISPIFRRKLAQIAKNSDHNIDPCLRQFSKRIFLQVFTATATSKQPRLPRRPKRTVA